MREEHKKGEQEREEEDPSSYFHYQFHQMYFHLSEKIYRVNCARLLLDRALSSRPFER
jgi:hypothetical protein